MAQTTAAKPKAKGEAQVSTDGTNWNHLGGEAVKVTPSGGDQRTGSTNTLDGSAPVVVGSNKMEEVEVQVDIVYTKTASQSFDRVRDAFDSATAKELYFRYAPEGGIGTVVGNEVYTIADDAGTAVAAQIVNCNPPEIDANSGDVMMASFTLRGPKWLRGTTTT